MGVLALYNFVYPSQVRKSEEELQIKLPAVLRVLLVTNKLLSIFIILTIIFILIKTVILH